MKDENASPQGTDGNVKPGSTSDGNSGANSRDRLINAGWKTSDELPLAKIFAGVTSAKVADRAGVTTGSFFHHFANASEFTDAMALSLIESRHAVSPLTDGPRIEFVELLELMKVTLHENWTANSDDADTTARFRRQMTLWAHHEATLSKPTDEMETLGDILRQGYTEREGSLTGLWHLALEKSGREVLSPFSIEIIAVAITALYEGLRIREAVDPTVVGEDLFSDIGVAIATSLTGPRGGRPYFEASSLQIANQPELSPQARSGVRRKGETRAKIVHAATGMFTDGWEHISAADIAERAGVSNQTILNLFRGVRGVAAATFAVHGLALYSFAVTKTDDEPFESLRTMLFELVQRVSVDRQAARALLSERMETIVERGSSLDMVDIRIEVPLGAAVARMLSRMGRDGNESLKVSSTIVNYVLATAIWDETEPREIVDSALRLIPPERLESVPHNPS